MPRVVGDNHSIPPPINPGEESDEETLPVCQAAFYLGGGSWEVSILKNNGMELKHFLYDSGELRPVSFDEKE